MTKIRITRHLHLYKRFNLARKKGVKEFFVLKCIKPLCSHHVPVNMALGKIAECNRCGEPFILNKETILLAKPHCSNCIVRKAKPEMDAITDFLKDEGI